MKKDIINFLKDNNAYDQFCSELKKQLGLSFDLFYKKKYEMKRKQKIRHLLYAISWRDSFDAKDESSKKKSFEYWSDLNVKYHKFINEKYYYA